MFTCPVCNGFKNVKKECPNCHKDMADQGRISDYLDDYSPYLDYAGTNLVDGIEDSEARHVCVHLMKCSDCKVDKQVPIQEEML